MSRGGAALSCLLAAAACADDAPGPDPDAVVCSRGTPDLAVTTLAGCELPGDADGARVDVRFRNPTNVVIDAGGGVFVADFDNSRLRRVEPDGVTSTIVVRPDFKLPFGLAFAADGSLFVETDDNDQGVHSLDSGTIWRVNTATGEAVVVARDLGRPRGLAVLPDGRIAMSDHMHHVVSILDPATGLESPLAGMQDLPGFANGTGSEARFAQPYDIVVLADGDLAVADQDNHRIRRVTLAGVVSDLAGSDLAGSTDGPIAAATFDAPQGLAIGPDGLYVTDVRSFTIRRIADGMVETVAGDGMRGFVDADQPRTARFAGLEGIAADASRLVIADGNRGDGSTFHRVRIVDLSALP